MNNLVDWKRIRIFAGKKKKGRKMEKNTIQFSNKPGTFRDSIRAYREYKKDWQARMEVKLSKMEEDIQKAKSDQFYKIEAI